MKKGLVALMVIALLMLVSISYAQDRNKYIPNQLQVCPPSILLNHLTQNYVPMFDGSQLVDSLIHFVYSSGEMMVRSSFLEIYTPGSTYALITARAKTGWVDMGIIGDYPDAYIGEGVQGAGFVSMWHNYPLMFGTNHQVRLTIDEDGIGEYADNASAKAAGLRTHTVYRTGDVLKIVH